MNFLMILLNNDPKEEEKALLFRDSISKILLI